MNLGEYLKSPRPAWDWKTHDCCRWVARWIVERGHPDPMAFIGHRYATRIGALRAIKRGGGLVALWTRGMADAGLCETDELGAGDVAVLRVPTEDGINEACGIWTGQRWVLLHYGGLMFGVGEPLRVWRV